MIQKIDSNKFSLTILKVTTFSRIRHYIIMYSAAFFLFWFGNDWKNMAFGLEMHKKLLVFGLEMNKNMRFLV